MKNNYVLLPNVIVMLQQLHSISMRYYLYALGLSLALASCHDKREDDPQPESKDFTVGYFFNNQSNARIQNVTLSTKTFYPDKNDPGNNSMHVFDRIYFDVTANQQIAHASTEPHMEKTLYPGCLTYMKVVLSFRTPVYSPYNTGTEAPRNFRVFELPVDTVTAAANCTRTFNWPADTLKYRELNWW